MNAVSHGVCYHHAGLSLDERQILEAAIRSRVIRVTIATTTLAVGVDFPVEVVVLYTLKSGGDDIAAGEYKQMIGRAGRYASGEVFVIEHPENKQKALQLINQKSPEVRSVLTLQERGLTRALLECVCLGLITSCSSLHQYVQHTLVAQQSTDEELKQNVEDALQFLQAHQIITAVSFEDQYLIQPTRLGRAISASSLPIEESVLVYRDLYLHQTHVSLQSNLFLVYLVTPTFVTPTPRWDVYERVASLSSDDHSSSSH